MSRLICDKHVKEFILKKAESMRKGWDVTCVSKSALDKIEAKVRAMIIQAVKSHPTRGKTFTEII